VTRDDLQRGDSRLELSQQQFRQANGPGDVPSSGAILDAQFHGWSPLVLFTSILTAASPEC
jgi:hypothetical protein